jgi:hypothetical protein
MEKRKLTTLKVIVITCILLVVMLSTGCFEEIQITLDKKDKEKELHKDNPSILPNWKDGDYHDYYATTQLLNDLNDKYPELTNVFSIGKSVLNRDIWCIRITNENNFNEKYSCLIDGCIHGNEWEGGETCLYLAEFLLINFELNKTVENILNTSEIYIVPLLNPDGRQANSRWNENGIDLNRNYNVHFGRLRSDNYPLGKLFGRFKIPYIYRPLKKTYATNSGRYPFSEPETRAIRNFMKSLHKYSFYMNCHTATHNFGAPVTISYKPEFIVTDHERNILNTAIDWVDDNTEYSGIFGEKFMYTGIGCSMDWVFFKYRIPSFTFELLSRDYEPWLDQGKHDNLVHWMKTGLPVFMYLLVNIEKLNNWETPDIQPSLPEGVPPSPLKY